MNTIHGNAMSLRNPQESRANFTHLEYSSINCLGGGLDYGERIRRAHKEWELAHDAEMSWAEVARQCQKLLKRPVDPATMTRWKTGKQEPTLDEFRALAKVLEVDPARLAFASQMPPGTTDIPILDETAYPPPKELRKPARGKRKRGNG